MMLPIVLRSLCRSVALGVNVWNEFLTVYFLLGMILNAVLIIQVYSLCYVFSRDSEVCVVSGTLCMLKLVWILFEKSSHRSWVINL